MNKIIYYSIMWLLWATGRTGITYKKYMQYIDDVYYNNKIKARGRGVEKSINDL